MPPKEGKTEAKEEAKAGTLMEVRRTGKEVDAIITSLIGHAYDSVAATRLQNASSLIQIGSNHTDAVLSACVAYIQRRPGGKIEMGHRVVLLRIIGSILESSREQVSSEAAAEIIAFACREMVASEEVKEDWQGPASQIIVLLSTRFCIVCVDELLRLFHPGVVPHYQVVHALAQVAAANGLIFTTRLRDVMSRTVPVLGAIKPSHMQWVFAAAVGRFAEAVHYFHANADEEKKRDIPVTLFEGDMASAFDVILAKWLISKEPKVRFAVVESLGLMASCVDRANFEAKVLKLVPVYLAMYKKEKEHLPISHGLCNILLVAVKDDSKCLEAQLPILLQSLFPMICQLPDFSNATGLKNHNELLRSFEILAKPFLDNVLHFVVSRFQLKDAPTRIGALVILRHFVNSLDALLEDKKPLIMSSVTTLVGEDNLAVKKAIMQLIVSMGNQGYMTLEGGQALVRFILKQCAINAPDDAESKVGTISPLQIRKAGDQILTVFAQKVPSTHKVLWPYMLEFLNDGAFTHSMATLAGCIQHLGSLKREAKEADYVINFETQVNIPSPQIMLSRLMVLACVPFRRRGLGMNVVLAMGALGPIIHGGIGTYWDQSVPALVTHLEAHQSEDSLNVSKWQDSLLRMFKETIALIDRPAWLHELVAAMSAQFALYPHDHDLQRVIHRYLGALLARIDEKRILENTIDLMLRQVDHKDDTERQGIAWGLGLAASKHLDIVLPKLTAELGPPAKAAPSGGGGWFGGGKDDAKSAAGDHKRSTVVLCYGYVAAYADPSLILSRLDVHILHNLMPVMVAAKSVFLKVNVIKSLDLIGKALHVTRLPEAKKTFVLKERDKLVAGLVSYLDDRVGAKDRIPPSNEIRLLGLNAASTLANLEPPIPLPLRGTLFDAVLPFYALAIGEAKETKETKESKEVKGEEKEPSGGESVMEQLMANLNTLLSSIIQMQPTIPSLVDMLKRLEKYLVSERAIERERACATYLVLLKKFVSKCVHEKFPQEEKAFPELGNFLGVLLPRCSDTVLAIRQTAAENIQALLYINQILHNPENPKPVHEIKLITDIRNRMEATPFTNRVPVIRDLAGILVAVLDIDELTRLLKALFVGLNDPDTEAAMGAAEVFKGLVERQGRELVRPLPILIVGLLEAVKIIKRPPVKEIVLCPIRTLTKQHFEAVTTQLLAIPVPLPKEVVEGYLCLCDTDDKELATQTIRTLYVTLNETPLVTDKPAPVVMTATAALAEVLVVPQLKPLIEAHYPALFCSLLMRTGTAQAVGGISSTDACRALKAFLEAMDEKTMLEDMKTEGVWPALDSKSYDDGVTKLTKIICGVHIGRKRELLAFLSKFYSQQSYIGQRVVATAMLAEFVNHSREDAPLLRELVKFLLPRVADKIEKVRKQALRGLGNLVSVWSSDVSGSASAVLAALTSAAEDQDSEVAAEAVASLTRIVQVVDKDTIGPMLINICFRMRPAFDRNDSNVRSAAYTLFGELCRFGVAAPAESKTETKEASSSLGGLTFSDDLSGSAGVMSNFLDQLHTNVPTFLVHINDEDAAVRKSCMNALRKVAVLIGEPVVAIVGTRDPPSDPAVYDEFIKEITPAIVRLHPDRLRGYLDSTVSYFTSRWNAIRGNATILLAWQLAAATADDRRKINVNANVAALIKMLDQPTPEVRAKAAKGLGLLHEC